MTFSRLRVAVLISGTGSNLKTLIDAGARGRLDLDICGVISNKAEAAGLLHASRAGIPVSVIDVQNGGHGAKQDREILQVLNRLKPDLVVLAGYMRVLGAGVVQHFLGRMINLHPSLLPEYPGLDTYRRALADGASEHGGSIHFVTEALDAGPVISQVRIPVHAQDDPQTLARRLSPLEHQLLVATIELFIQHRVKMQDGWVVLDEEPLSEPLLLNAAGAFD